MVGKPEGAGVAPEKAVGSLPADVTLLLVRELRAFAREIELFPDDQLIWATLPGITNSAGSLATHVCGNLQHFVGRILGGTSYLRNREFEFGRRAGTRRELVDEIEATIHVVERVLPSVSAGDLTRPYPEAVGGVTLPTGLFLLHLTAHLAHHLGQAGYLRRALTGDNHSAAPLPLGDLAGR
jgi:hypothetical protein